MRFSVPFVWGAHAAPSGGMLRIIGLGALLWLSALLTACSVVKIAYNQADELAYLQLDSYFDFNSVQTLRLKDELIQIQRWHRNTQLPAYVELLGKWQALLPGELSEAQVCSASEEVRSSLLAMSSRTEGVAAELAVTLTSDQLKFLQGRFSKLNREYRNNFLEGPASKLLDKRLKKAVKRAEMLYGPLAEEQLAVLRREMALSVFDAGMSLTEYQRRQQDALRTLATLTAGGGATAAQASVAVRGYFDRSLNSPNPAYRSYQERLIRNNCKIFALLHNSTTPAQRAQAVKTLGAYAQDFRALASQNF